MARWKLVAPHYLLTTGIEWQYQETDRTTGRPVRKVFNVPLYLDPNTPSDWNYRWGMKDNEDGEIIVCLPGKGNDKDIQFFGDPTPDMIPLDDEAKTLSASFTDHWKFKPDAAETTYSQSLVDKFHEEQEAVRSQTTQSAPDGLAELVAAISAQTASNQELIQTLAKRKF